MFSMLRSCRCLPSTSTLASVSVPQQQQQLVRSLATSTRSSAASTSNKPKRDETTYGLPPSIPRADWPLEKDTDTRAHPLWRFFHDKESLEVPDKRKDNSSRSWTSFELRRKSFVELHQLWYVCVRERNVLLTQREEARRIRLDLAGFTAAPEKLRMVQKSMARLKQTISERRHAALQAAAILRSRGNEAGALEIEKEGKGFEDLVE